MGFVYSVSKCEKHEFSKRTAEDIYLLKGEGVAGDAHRGVTVKHRSRVRADPTQPNLRQVHLIHNELILELQENGFNVAPGIMGENITTANIAILSLPTDAVLHIGQEAVIKITGLRNPCIQLDHYQKGLMSAVLDRDEEGNLIRKAGVMAVVLKSGTVRAGDPIEVHLPPEPHRPLERV
ncbi:MAG: MOSC domain-containing protein [Candidatus Promineifilaceae bacterium]|nr:MOSC domain-containing protein [Candidatus Promineifilaceae bacterium]